VAGPEELSREELIELVRAQAQVIAALQARVAELERRLGADSSPSSTPPSQDSPYRKPPRRSGRTRSKRRPGKQPGQPGQTMELVDDPDEVVTLDPTACTDCGADLAGAPVRGVQRRQVVDVPPPPPPWVTEYRIVSRVCPCCAGAATGLVPAGAPARVQYGPGVLARAGELTCAHYLPVARATRLMRSLLGLQVSVGFIAGVRHRAARLLEREFLPRVREPLRSSTNMRRRESLRAS